MLQQLFEAIGAQAREAAAARPFKVEGMPHTAYIQTGATYQPVELPPADRCHRLDSIAALIEFAENGADAHGATAPVLWHHGPKDAEIVYCLDDTKRRDVATVRLPLSREFAYLVAQEAAPDDLAQAAFIRRLRFELGADRESLAPFRRLDWNNGATTSGEVVHGRDRLGKQIQAEVTGADELPEVLAFTIPVYELAGAAARRQIVCDLHIDPQRQTLAIRPKPGELTAAVDSIHEDLARQFAEALPDVPIYYGRM